MSHCQKCSTEEVKKIVFLSSKPIKTVMYLSIRTNGKLPVCIPRFFDKKGEMQFKQQVLSSSVY